MADKITFILMGKLLLISTLTAVVAVIAVIQVVF